MERRTDLDWLRIIAFGLLILYHVGLFYMARPWHVNSIHGTDAIEPLLFITTPWRIPLLFVISGVATRFMMDKMSTGAFMASRSTRLLIPLVFGALVIVAPQTYVELVEKANYSGSLIDFYGKYLTNTGHWISSGQEIVTPMVNHLWFVQSLFIYTVLTLIVGRFVKRLPARWIAPFARAPLIVIAPWAILTVLVIYFQPRLEPLSLPVLGEMYHFALYLAFFLFGYGVAKHEAFFEQCERIRWWMLAAAIGGYLFARFGGEHWRLVLSMIELQAWAAILAAFGFARRHLRHDGPVRRYLTDAIFPYYIIHQTTLVVAGHYLTQMHIPAWVEAPVLIATIVASCALGYEIIRRVWFLRPLFGLKLEAKKPAPVEPTQPGAASA